MHTITREWIFAHRTERGAWSREQLAALGITWPPSIGWINRLEGTEIPESAAWEFQISKFITAKYSRALNRGIPLPAEIRAKIQAMHTRERQFLTQSGQSSKT